MGRYAPRRSTPSWLTAATRHGRKRIARLTRAAAMRGRAPKRWKKTTVADPAAAARADLIRRDFTAGAARVNSRWCGDITYSATVIDIASRRVAGYAMADHLRTELVADALANAVAARDPNPGVIFHSDRAASTPPQPSPPLATECQVALSPLRHRCRHRCQLGELMGRMGHSTTRAALIYQHRTTKRDRLIAAAMSALVEAELTQPEKPSGTQRARAQGSFVTIGAKNYDHARELGLCHGAGDENRTEASRRQA
jgi:hypothetical protein